MEVAANAMGWADKLLTIHKPESIACRQGCSYCCNIAVTAMIPEVLLIADLVRQTRTQDQIEGLKQRCREHMAASTPSNYLDVRHPCPLLEGEESSGRCSIYENRPLVCRGYHSVDVNACRRHYADEGKPVVPCWGIQISSPVMVGMAIGLAKERLSSDLIWLPHGLLIALDNEDAAQRYLEGQPIFAPAFYASMAG